MASIVVAGDTSGSVTLSAPLVAGTSTVSLQPQSGTMALTLGQIGMKNRIINGAMVIDQRYAGTAYTSTNGNFYVLDRWKTFETGGVTGRFTVQQNAGSVTPPAGFSNYLGITSLTGSAVTAGMIQSITQVIEGFNASDFAWGTANAMTVTVSFWVRSSLTGTFGGVLSNGAVNYSYPFTYTISAANTWEYKTVTITGPTAGTWGSGNSAGPTLQFVIGTGSTFRGSAGSWSANGFYGVTGAVDLTATNGATLYITGVQLEVGSTATSFDFRPFTTEYQLCQRYYYQVGGNSFVGTAAYTAVAGGMVWNTGAGDFMIPYKVTMRSAPTIINSNMGVQYTTVGAVISSLDTVAGTTQNAAFVRANFASPGNSWPAGGGVNMCSNNNTAAYIAFNAEL